MAEDENVSGETVTPVETQTTDGNSQEQQTVADDVKKVATEPVDETGVPLKNREAEARRKAEKALQSPETKSVSSEDEAIKIVENIAQKQAEEQINKRIEPLLVKQFLMENPDASALVDDINRIRQTYPELASVDKLDLAYKIAKAEQQDALIAKKLEQGRQETLKIKEKSSQAGIEGAGSSKTVGTTILDKINSATSLKELQELERSIMG